MADDDITRRMSEMERILNNGRFVRRDTYEADQRAQEKTDIAQERRFAEVGERIDGVERRMDAGFAEAREDRQWLRRQLITMLLSILVTAAIAALAIRAVS